MDRSTIQNLTGMLLGVRVWRFVLLAVFLYGAFTAWPDYKLPIGAGALLTLTALNYVVLSAERMHAMAQRSTWLNTLILQIGLSELHNMALGGERAPPPGGDNWVWEDAAREARRDLLIYDADTGGYDLPDATAVKATAVLAFALTAAADLALALGVAVLS